MVGSPLMTHDWLTPDDSWLACRVCGVLLPCWMCPPPTTPRRLLALRPAAKVVVLVPMVPLAEQHYVHFVREGFLPDQVEYYGESAAAFLW